MRKYHPIDPRSEWRFAQAVSPLIRADFHKKKVLDAGCGNGEKSYWAIRWGSREVTSIDADAEAVSVASKTLKPFSNAFVEQKDLMDSLGENRFDLAYSLGVISRLPDPALVIKNLTNSLKPHGVLLVSLSREEGSEAFSFMVNPIRTYIFSRLSLPMLDALSYLFTVIIFIAAKILSKASGYLAFLSRYSFFHLHDAILAEISAKESRLYTQEKAKALLSAAEFEEVHVFPSANEIEWTVVGLKK